MSTELYFEDFYAGQRFISGHHAISRAEAVGFAHEYDPQYFHVDEEAARSSPFGKLAVSGWQTAAITMRLKAKSGLEKVSGGLIGMGLESVVWPQPVYPGDTLNAVFTVLETRRSKSKPTHGVVKYRGETFNQNGEIVMRMVTAVWVPCRSTVA